MAVSKNQKVSMLKQLEEVGQQKSVVFLNTDGSKEALTAQSNFELRKKANAGGVKLQVVKNTLIRLAYKDVDGFPEEFTGSTLVAYLNEQGLEGADEVKNPKTIVSLVEEDFEDSLNVMGAIVNGEWFDQGKTSILSKTPSLSDSMSMLAGMLQQAAGGKLAQLIKEIPNQVARGVSQYSKTLS